MFLDIFRDRRIYERKNLYIIDNFEDRLYEEFGRQSVQFTFFENIFKNFPIRMN